MADDVEVVTSELVTNATVHGGGDEIQLRLVRSSRGVLVKVWDRSPHPPLARCGPDLLPGTENGRGLVIVDALSSRWGWYPEGAGKVVWAEIEAEAGLAGGTVAS